jgi:hypothetical protein
MVEELQMPADLEDQLSSVCDHLPHDENQIRKLILLLNMVSTTHKDRCHNLGIPLGCCIPILSEWVVTFLVELAILD